jgi:outer membrane protein
VSALDLARSNLKISRGNFERHIGRQPNGLTEPAAPMKILPKSLEEAISISSRENPSMVASLYREQGARHTVDKIWGELLPSLQVDASYSKRFDPSIVTDRSETTAVTGRLTVPLYTSGEVQARVRQAKHTHVSRIQEIEQTRGDVQALVVQAWAQLSAARAQLESDNAQVAALSTALTGVREEEKVGQRTLLDILNAEQELLNAQVNLAATKRNIVVTAYTLLSSVGRLNIQETGGVNQVYDADAHYFEVRRKWWGVSITHADGRRELLDLWQSLGQGFHTESTDQGPPPTIHRPTASAPQRPVK